MFPVLQGAPPLLQLLLAGLPHLMEGYSQGALGGGAVVEEEVQQALAASLLPPPSDVCSQGWVLDDGSLWWVPLKPLSLFLNDHGIHLYRGSWAGLVPGQSWWGTVTVLAPCGPHMGDPLQRQQQQQQQQQQQVPWAGHDMPGDWWVAASASGMIRWRTLRSRPATFVVSSPLLRLLEPLAADHFLLRAQHSQVRRGYNPFLPGAYVAPPRCGCIVCCTLPATHHMHQHVLCSGSQTCMHEVV
jgi:hypothetical protein